jgi:4-phytase/acid phosphatase
MSALQPGCPGAQARWSPSQARDPIFNGTDAGACAVDRSRALASMAAVKDDPLITAPLAASLDDLQRILAPNACSGGPGVCLRDQPPSPFPAAAALADDLMLEYVDDMPMDEVGWGKATAADIRAVMPIHEHAFAELRDDTYLAARRGAPMADLVLAALAGRPVRGGPQAGPQSRLLVLAGHDTNLAWMSGLFGVEWRFPDNPQFTAPSTTLAFELWRDRGKDYVRPVIFYLGLEQMRTLKPAEAEVMPLTFGGCESGPLQSCPLEVLKARIDALVPDDCGAL